MELDIPEYNEALILSINPFSFILDLFRPGKCLMSGYNITDNTP